VATPRAGWEPSSEIEYDAAAGDVVSMAAPAMTAASFTGRLLMDLSS
jgi:hypothetical protein